MFKILNQRIFFRCIISLLLAFILAFFPALRVSAQENASEGQASHASAVEGRGGYRSVSILIGKEKYGGRAFLKNSTTYVGIREFSMHMGVESVSWNAKAKTASASSDSLSLTAKYMSTYMVANGRYLWAGSGIIIEGGTMFVPLRAIAKAFGYSVGWDAKSFTATLKAGAPLASGDSFYDADSLYWLSRIIHAEAQGESLLGKVAVGTVVLNRVKSSLYPNTVKAVVFDKKNGVQFTPAKSGTIYCTPSEESIIAAKLCLDGASVSDRVLFFVNEALATSSWVSDNRDFVMAVGNHKFFA